MMSLLPGLHGVLDGWLTSWLDFVAGLLSEFARWKTGFS
jgi:hypothetical protein